MTRLPRGARFVVCVSNAGYQASLERNKIYVALPDREAEAAGDIRVIDASMGLRRRGVPAATSWSRHSEGGACYKTALRKHRFVSYSQGSDDDCDWGELGSPEE